MSLRRLVPVGVLMELCYLSFYGIAASAEEVLLFIGVGTLTFLLLAFAMYEVRALERPSSSENRMSGPSVTQWIAQSNSGTRLATIIGFGILFRLTLVAHDPVASDDIYRYLWDGKVSVHGINPFALAPNDARLGFLHTEDLPSKVNFPHMRTIYPPLAQALFLLSHILFGDSVSGLKLLLVCIDIVALALLLLLLRQFNARPETVILYAWSPLPIMYFGLDGHIDALGIPFLLLLIYFVAKEKHLAGAVSLGISALAKLYPLFIAPLLARVGQGPKKLWMPLLPVLMLVAGCWLYLEPTGGLYESFLVFNATWKFNGSVFEIIHAILKANEDAHLASGILFFICLGFVFFIDRPLVEKIFLAFLGYIVVSPVVHPWYLTWLGALIVLRWSLAVFIFLGLSTLSNIVVYHYYLTGIWENQPALLFVEYIPFYVLIAWEVIQGKFNVVRADLSLGRSQ